MQRGQRRGRGTESTSQARDEKESTTTLQVPYSDRARDPDDDDDDDDDRDDDDDIGSDEDSSVPAQRRKGDTRVVLVLSHNRLRQLPNKALAKVRVFGESGLRTLQYFVPHCDFPFFLLCPPLALWISSPTWPASTPTTTH